MIELLLLLTLVGLIFASAKRMGFANPFQIYFSIWFVVLFAYYLTKDSFIRLPAEFLLLLLVAKSVSLAILAAAYWSARLPTSSTSEDWRYLRESKLFLLAQVAVLVAMPFSYQRAVELAGGESIFTVIGYVSLRAATTDDGLGFGVLSYFSVLSSAVTALAVRAYFDRAMPFYRLLLAIVASVFYTYLSTGRTFVLFSLLLVVFPLILVGIVRLKGVIFSLLLIAILFVGVATMTSKGISAESSLVDNIESFMYSLRAYTIAPLLAFHNLIESSPALDLGRNSFRLFYLLLQAVDLADAPPPLIREYTTVPDLTNVYTVYEVYFRDFSYAGIIVPPAFLLAHWWLFKNALNRGGPWAFYYSASVYALVMQFFQDQYFSLLSMWIQLAFWFWLLIPSKVLTKRE